MTVFVRLSTAILAMLLLGGCSTYHAQHETERGLAGRQRYFVKTNFNDNYGIAVRLVRALEARGYQAERGPMTMMPRGAQVLVTYDDRWNWDFKNHITYLNIDFRDPKTERVLATATFSGAAALTTSSDEVIDRLLNKIYAEPRP